MTNSNALTVPMVVMLLSCALSGPATNLYNNTIPSLNYQIESIYQTTSINPIAKEFNVINPRTEALDLFGIQSNFTPDEQDTYMRMLKRNSEKIGINVFDFFK